jgi:hypothetical protein
MNPGAQIAAVAAMTESRYPAITTTPTAVVRHRGADRNAVGATADVLMPQPSARSVRPG